MKKRLFNQQSEPGSREAATAQRLSVKARIMMALFALMLIPQGTWAQGAAGNSYNLWIGGTQVTDANKGAILSPDRGDSVKVINSAETWSLEFDSERSVLILKNVDIQREIRSGLDNLTIRFEGTNKINSDSRGTNSDNAYFYGITTYDPTSTSNPRPLHPSAALTIEKSGDGSLELDGRDIYSAVTGFASVSYGSGCYLKSDVATTYNENLKLYESFCGGDYSNVAVVTITTDTFYPLWFYYRETTSPWTKHFKQVDGNNYSNISTETLTKGTISFDPANSKLSLNDVIFDGKILSSLGNLTINLTGTNQINLSDSGTCILSAKSGKLTLEKAAPNASLKLDCWQWNPTHPVIQGFTSLVYPDFSLVTSKAANYGNFFDDNSNSNTILGLYYPGETDNTIKAVNDALFTSVVSYGLSIAGTPVTSANAGNVFAGTTNDGKVTFLPDANTANSGKLTLNGFEKTDADAAIVSGLDNLTIEFSGANELGNGNSADGYVQSTNATAKLTFKGGTAGGTLDLKANGVAAVNGFASVSYDGAYWTYSEPITYTTSKQYESRYGALKSLKFTTTRQYLLWLGAEQVSETNSTNISVSSGTASYNADDNILTLDNCSFGSYDGLMCGLSSLTISLKGNNCISAASHSGYSPLYSIVSGAKLTIEKAAGEKNCSLELDTYAINDPTDNTPVVNGFGTVVYTGFDLDVTIGSGTTLTANTVYGAVLRSLSFSGGDGTSGSPYLIATKEDLKDLGAVVNSGVLDTNGKYFKVTASIDCSNLSNFTPIAYDEYHAFAGSLDGNGYTISNLQAKADYAGLFGYVKDGTISNLTLHNCNFIADNDYSPAYAGTIAGTVDGSSIISNIKVTGTSTVSVSTPNGTNAGFAGALFGEVESGTPSNNYYEYTVKVTGHDNVLKTGYTPRGDGSTGGDITASDGAVLYTRTLNTATVANGTIVPWYTSSNTYTDNGKFVPGQTAYFKVTPATGYAIDASSPKVTYTAAGASQTINGALETSYSSDGVNVYSFTMPDAADVTATATMVVDISSTAYTASIAPADYSPTGSLEPTKVTLTKSTDGSTLDLTNGTDFTITGKTLGGTAAEFINAGDYKVSIQGKGNYTGTISNLNYTIKPKSVVGLEVNVSGTYTYTGSAIQPTSIEVKDGSKTLTSGTDYTIYTYSNNVDVADANDPTAPPTVTIIGMGNYDSKTTENGHFTIAQADFTTTTLLSIAAVADQTYTGSEITPTPAVTFNGTTLTAGTDFEYDYANNTDAASSSATPAPTVIVNGKGSFTGSNSVKFTINPKSIRGTTVAVSGTYTYTGSTIVPPVDNVTVTDGTKVLKNGKDYTYGCSSNINAGTATITVTGMGNYDTTTSENGTFTIDQATITDVEVDATEFTFAPSDTKTVTITKVSAGSLVLGTSDYSLSGTQSAIAVGSYQFTVTGTGNFQGSKNVDWKINERPASINFSGRTFKTFYDANETFLVPDGVKAYIVTGVNASGDKVTISEVSYIQKDVPVLLESVSGAMTTKKAETFTGNLLKYASTASPVSANGNQYVLYNNEFIKATGTIGSNKGAVYLDLSGLSRPARSLTIERNNSATAIEAVFDEDADGEDKWYDMQGRQINKPSKAGLYIKNGKKVVVNNK